MKSNVKKLGVIIEEDAAGGERGGGCGLGFNRDFPNDENSFPARLSLKQLLVLELLKKVILLGHQTGIFMVELDVNLTVVVVEVVPATEKRMKKDI